MCRIVHSRRTYYRPCVPVPARRSSSRLQGACISRVSEDRGSLSPGSAGHRAACGSSIKTLLQSSPTAPSKQPMMFLYIQQPGRFWHSSALDGFVDRRNLREKCRC